MIVVVVWPIFARDGGRNGSDAGRLDPVGRGVCLGRHHDESGVRILKQCFEKMQKSGLSGGHTILWPGFESQIETTAILVLRNELILVMELSKIRNYENKCKLIRFWTKCNKK